MGEGDERWAKRFPALFAERYVEYADARVRLSTEHPPEDLINRLHLVAETADGSVVVCRSVQDWRFLPGGTREPNESLIGLAARELREEAVAWLADHDRTHADTLSLAVAMGLVGQTPPGRPVDSAAPRTSSKRTGPQRAGGDDPETWRR